MVLPFCGFIHKKKDLFLKTELIIPEKIKVWPQEARQRAYGGSEIQDGR